MPSTELNHPETGSRAKGHSPGRRVLGLAVTAAVLGLLLWAKLILVTGYPRTAVAIPDLGAPQPDAQSFAAPK